MSTPQRPPSRQVTSTSASGTPVATTTHHTAGNGATVVRRRKHGAAWLPWAILGLLALLALAVWALSKIGDDDEVDTTETTLVVGTTVPGGATPAAGTAAPAAGDPSATTAAGGTPGVGGTATTVTGTPGASLTTVAGAPAPGAAGSLIANGRDDVIAAASSGGLAALVGGPVTGSATVESVVSDEGFWVGTSPQQRVFVHLSPESRGTNGESPFQVVAGQTVTMVGSVVPFNDPAVAGVEAGEGLEQVRQQGALVEVQTIQLVG